jgi:hypothetical protein
MSTHKFLPVSVLVLTIVFGNPAPSAAGPPPRSVPTRTVLTRDACAVERAFGDLPMRFEANVGQTDGRVRFAARGNRGSLFLTPTEAVLILGRGGAGAAGQAPAALRLRMAGANPAPRIDGEAELEGTSNYLVGSDRTRWRTNIPSCGAVRYRDVYPGIDLVYYGNQNDLEYDFVVAPGADPRAIVLRVEGAQRLELDAGGELVLTTPAGELRQRPPVLFQQTPEGRRFVVGRYVLLGGGAVGFAIASYDRTKPLVIDPVLAYSTFLGGSFSDAGWAIAVDRSGSAHVTGDTGSPDFPTVNPYDAMPNGVFVTKLNPAGNALVYSTYIGGSGTENSRGIALDESGSVYITGETTSSDFPTAGAYDSSHNGGRDAFIVKLSKTGDALVYSTFLGGGLDDRGNAIAIDAVGTAYVAGTTYSVNFPTTGAYDGTFNGGGFDAFVTKLGASGEVLVYSTYLGGSSFDEGFGITLDGSGAAYVTGYTWSADFPTANAFDVTVGVSDAYVTKLNAQGDALVYSTLLGGALAGDIGFDIAVDALGSAYVTGNTSSGDFPTVNAFDSTHSTGGNDAFVAKLEPTGDALAYSSYLGGRASDFGRAIAVNAAGAAYVTGYTGSGLDFPIVGVIGAYNGGEYDAFVTRVGAAGDALEYSTFLGGGFADFGFDIVLDQAGAVYVTGRTESPDFPVVNAHDASLSGPFYDAFVAKPAQTGPAGNDTVGVFLPSPSVWFLRNANSSGLADLAFNFGPAGAGLVAISGDWDGDGDDTVGLYAPAAGAFFLRNTSAAGPAEIVFTFGPRGIAWVPVSGDWDNDGDDTVGLYDPAGSSFFLKNTNTPGPADLTFSYGPAHGYASPICGDWNGDGRDSVGIYFPVTAAFFLKNTNSPGPADAAFSYGPPNGVPVAGDWDGDRIDTVGLYVPPTRVWFLRNVNSAGPAAYAFSYGPSNAVPIVGDWDGR